LLLSRKQRRRASPGGVVDRFLAVVRAAGANMAVARRRA